MIVSLIILLVAAVVVVAGVAVGKVNGFAGTLLMALGIGLAIGVMAEAAARRSS